MEISERIREIRESLNLNQGEFGNRLTISQPQISCYEKGTANIPERVVNQIVKEFKVNKEWLLYGKGSMYKFDKDEMDLSAALAKINLSDNPALKELVQKLTILDTEYLESINNLIDVIIKKEQA